jgi:hypothetical protein
MVRTLQRALSAEKRKGIWAMLGRGEGASYHSPERAAKIRRARRLSLAPAQDQLASCS